MHHFDKNPKVELTTGFSPMAQSVIISKPKPQFVHHPY